MSLSYHRLATFAWWTFAAVTIVLAVVMGAAWLSLPWLAGHPQWVERRLQSAVDQPVSVARVQAEWHGLMPEIRLYGLRVLNDAGTRVLLQFDEAVIALDVTASLASGEPRLERVRLIGGDLHILRTADGDIRIDGMSTVAKGNMNSQDLIEALQGITLDLVSSRLRWEDRRLDVDYRFRNIELSLTAAGARYRLAARLELPAALGGRLRLVADIHGQPWQPDWRARMYAQVDAIRLAALPEELSVRRVVKDLKIRGGVANFEVWGEWRDASLAHLLGRFDVQDPALAGARVAGNLDGHFRFDGDSGQLALIGGDLAIHYPDWFAAPIGLDRARADLDWRREGERLVLRSPSFRLRNEALDLGGRFALRTRGLQGGTQSPFLDLRLDVKEFDAASIKDYLPVGIMPYGLYEWLNRAVVQAHVKRGELLFQGPLQDFPFERGEGVFEARLQAEDGVLDYKQGWPRLEALRGEVTFRGKGLMAEIDTGRVLDAEIKTATIGIEDLRRPILEIHGLGRGPLSDVFRFLRASGIAGPDTPLDALTPAGPSELTLDLRLPVIKEIDAPKTITGRLAFDDAELRVNPLDLTFSHIQGAFRFGPDGATGDDIRAVLRGEPVTASVTAAPQGYNRVQIRGQLPADALFRGLEHPVLEQIDGVSLWEADIGVPGFKATDQPLTVTLGSDLAGTAVGLPPPFAKPADERRPFRLRTRFAGGQVIPVELRYGKAAAVIELGKNRQGLVLTRGGLRFHRGDAELPEQGIRISGHLDAFSVSAWQPWIGKGPDAAGLPGAAALRELEVTVDRVAWSGQRFADVKLDAKRENRLWRADVASPDIAGHIEWPLASDASRPLVATFDHLRLATGSVEDRKKLEERAGTRLDPRRLPGLRISSGELIIDDLAFSSLHLDAKPVTDGLHFDALRVSAPAFSGRAEGQWLRLDGAPQSRFRFELDSSDLERTLDHFDVDNNFGGGKAQTTLYLGWPDGPHRFGFKGLEGRAHVLVTGGRLREVELGAGRLLGLFNLTALPRRLSLDFSDLFRKGFVFDRIEGEFTIEGDEVYTQDLIIVSPSAQIAFEGRIGLAARDYDLVITVTPELSATLPVAGTILGGPAVGAVLFIADQLLEQLGAGIDRFSQFKYRVAGPWKTPRIELVDVTEADRKPGGSDQAREILRPSPAR